MNVTVICSNNYYIKTSLSSGCVPATPKEFENGGFTLQTSQMFSVHTMPEEFKNATIGFAFEKKSVRENLIIVLTSTFPEVPFSKCFLFTKYEKPAFSNSSSLKSVPENLHFRDGLVWTVGLTVEIKLLLQIPPA